MPPAERPTELFGAGSGRRSSLRTGATLAVTLLLAVGNGCRRSTPPQSQAAVAAAPNILLVLVDTLRADRLGTYGYGRPTSPEIDRFAAQSTLFESARSQASCTFPSANSLLTSRYATRFLGQADRALGIPLEMPVLPEILGRHGYSTAAVSASAIVRSNPSRYNRHGGFGRGFEVFEESCTWKSARCVNRQALAILDSRRLDRPFFLYLHFLDPHAPYRPPAGDALRFATAPRTKRHLRRGDPNELAKHVYGGHPERVDRDDLRVLSDLYDDEIRSFDGQFAALLDEIERRKLTGTTVVVLAADHGEAFLEHGDIKHCRSVFDVEARVPLVIRVPGRAPQRIARAVENISLAPTLLALAGISAEPYGLEGVDLFAEPAASRPASSPAFSAQGRWRAATTERHKLIYDLKRNTVQEKE